MPNAGDYAVVYGDQRGGSPGGYFNPSTGEYVGRNYSDWHDAGYSQEH